MALNLNSSAAQAAVNNVKNAEQNKNATADGFEDGLDFEDLMADYNESNFGTASSSQGMGMTMNTGMGMDLTGGQGGMGGMNDGGLFGDAFNGNNLGGGMNGLNVAGQLGQQQMQQPAQPKGPTVTDVITDGTISAIKASGGILKSFVKSVQGITYDDFASLGMDSIYVGTPLFVIGLILLFAGGIKDANSILAFGKLLTPTGMLNIGYGAIAVGVMAHLILNRGEPQTKLSSIPDTPCIIDNQPVDAATLDDEYNALLDSFYDDDDFDLGNENDFESNFFNESASSNTSDDSDAFSSFFDAVEEEVKENELADNTALLDKLENTKVAKIDREYLMTEFIKFLPRNCKEFGQTTKISRDSSEFEAVRGLTLQALSSLSKIPLEELTVDLETLESSAFSYTMTVGRITGLNKLSEIANELQIYFRENSKDVSVIANVELEHGFYKISITKGNTDMVTIRDCLDQPEVNKFFMNKKNILPVIAGIDTYGEVILADMANYTSYMIAGKQRSGKSWYACSMFMSLMTFNTPLDVQILFIDPKKSSLYRTFSCMPHTIGVHDDSNIIDLLSNLINVEGERRKERLRAANKGYGVDSIKDYRKEGHKDMPYLFVVIDEFLTVMTNVENQGRKKEFNNLISTIITQLPFVGIHLLLIPHRAQGAVDKTVRANILYTAAVRCENSVVEEVLDTKWTRPLQKPGDMALKLQDVGKETFARAAVFTTCDEDNTTTIKDIAKAWYKIGAEVPNVNYGMLANKDLGYVSAMLDLNSDETKTLYSHDVSGYTNTPSAISPNIDELLNVDNKVTPDSIVPAKVSDSTKTVSAESLSAPKVEKQKRPTEDLNELDDAMLNRWRSMQDEEELEDTGLTGVATVQTTKTTPGPSILNNLEDTNDLSVAPKFETDNSIEQLVNQSTASSDEFNDAENDVLNRWQSIQEDEEDSDGWESAEDIFSDI